MGEDERQVGEGVGAEERTPEQIEAEIERTRREMGETVAAVAEKADVKAQAKSKVDETKARITDKKDEVLHRTREAAPDSAAQGADTVARAARDNRRAVIIGGAVLVAFLLGRASGRG
jgi:CHASE3 domain sensor protein